MQQQRYICLNTTSNWEKTRWESPSLWPSLLSPGWVLLTPVESWVALSTIESSMKSTVVRRVESEVRTLATVSEFSVCVSLVTESGLLNGTMSLSVVIRLIEPIALSDISCIVEAASEIWCIKLSPIKRVWGFILVHLGLYFWPSFRCLWWNWSEIIFSTSVIS